MSETYRDMKKHVWKGVESGNLEHELKTKKDEKVSALLTKASNQLLELLNGKDEAVTNLDSIQALLQEAVIESSKIGPQVRTETIQDYIMRSILLIKNKNQKITVDLVINQAKRYGVTRRETVKELLMMKKAGLIHFEGDTIHSPAVEVHLST